MKTLRFAFLTSVLAEGLIFAACGEDDHVEVVPPTCEAGFLEDMHGDCVALGCENEDCSEFVAAHCEMDSGAPLCQCDEGFVYLGASEICEAIPACTDDVVANEADLAQAVILPFVEANQICTSAPDYYKIDLAVDEWLFVVLEWTDVETSDLDLYLLNSQELTEESLIASSTGVESPEVFSFQADTAQTYYLVVSPWEIADSPYTLTMRNNCVEDYECGACKFCSPTTNPTNLCEVGSCTADDVADLAEEATVATALPVADEAHTLCSGDEDWYKFTVTAGQVFRGDVLFNGRFLDIDIKLYEGLPGTDSVTVATGTSESSDEYLTYTASVDGDLYFGVYPYSDDGAPYTLFASICGNEAIDGNEDCDGTKLDSKACTDFDFTAGTLSCDAECFFDLSGCTE